MAPDSKDRQMMDASIQVMKNAYDALQNSKIAEASIDLKDMDPDIQKTVARTEKMDTKGFDLIAENAIVTEFNGIAGVRSRAQNIYNESAVVLTEEKARVGSGTITGRIPTFISDPVDMSSLLETVIGKYGSDVKTLGEVFAKSRVYVGDNLRFDSCNSSLTMLKDNMIKYSLILNLFSGELFVAYNEGVFSKNIDKVTSLDDIDDEINFSTDDRVDTIFYNHGPQYKANREGTALKHLNLVEKIKKPGGPNRFAYLIDEEHETGRSPAGVIAYNGEKIQESLPSIAVAFFSKGQLEAFKLYPLRDNNAMRSGKHMTPTHESSLYKKGLMQDEGINLAFLNHYKHPSDFRDTLVIVPRINHQARFMLRGMVYEKLGVQIIGNKEY